MRCCSICVIGRINRFYFLLFFSSPCLSLLFFIVIFPLVINIGSAARGAFGSFQVFGGDNDGDTRNERLSQLHRLFILVLRCGIPSVRRGMRCEERAILQVKDRVRVC